MTPTDLRTRVIVTSALVLAGLAGVAVWLAGPAAALGLLASGGLTLGNFWWLARGVTATTDAVVGRRAGAAWVLAAAVRFAALAVALGVLLASGLVDPLGVVAGVVVLPCALVAGGLRAATEAGR